MCRAVWVVIAAPSDGACKVLRRAAGVEAQVVGMALDAQEARAVLAASPADVIVIDGTLPGARELVEEIEVAIVWFGGDPPARAHAHTSELDSVEGSITRALIARKKPV